MIVTSDCDREPAVGEVDDLCRGRAGDREDNRVKRDCVTTELVVASV